MDFPLKITDEALIKLIHAKETDEELTDNHFVRIACQGSNCAGVSLELYFDDEKDDTDWAQQFGIDTAAIEIVVDAMTQPYLENVSLTYESTDLLEGFRFVGVETSKKCCACGKNTCC